MSTLTTYVCVWIPSSVDRQPTDRSHLLSVAGVQGVHAQLDRQVLDVVLSYPVDELMNQKNWNEIFLVEEFQSTQ